MDYLRRIFGSINTQYLVRAYVFSFALFGLMAYFLVVSRSEATPVNWPVMAIFFISALLFPFSKLVYDELKSFLLGNNVFYLNALVVLFAKLFINVFLFSFAIFVAPLGVLYLHFRSR